MMLALYAGLSTLAAPLLRLHLQRRVGRGREIAARLGERRGVDATPRPPGLLVWLHAASVGETVSILPVIAALLAQEGVWVLVTTGTVTSAELLAARMGDAARLLHRFVPLDVPGWTQRFVAHWRPDVAGFVESEIWPNLLAACTAQGVRLMLINARISPSSLAHWLRVPAAARRVFGQFQAVQAQSGGDAERLVRLGARDVEHPGNLKFAAAPLPVDAAELARLLGVIGDRPVWLAASTHPGEERIAAEVHRALVGRYPRLLTIIAPRHPARGAQIEAEMADACPGVDIGRRASGGDPPDRGIWIADTLGELGLLYRLSPIAFVGCSLAVGGGHNPIEPARLGCAVAMGPLTENCRDAVTTLAAVGALQTVADGEVLADWVGGLLDDPARRTAMGDAARTAATQVADLPGRVADRLLSLARAGT